MKETRSVVQRYMLARAKHPHADDDALWIGKRGRLHANGIYQMVGRRCEDAGIPPVHPHMFRHTFAHQYLRAGGSEGDLMRVTNQEQPFHPIYNYALGTDAEEGLIVVDVNTLADDEPRNNFLKRAATWNEGGILKGARHLAIAGRYVADSGPVLL